MDGRFEKGLILAQPLGYIYTNLEVSLAGLPEQAGR